MGLFKEVKKPVIRQSSSMGTTVNSARPRYAEKTAPCISSCPSGTDVRGWLIPLAQHDAYGRTTEQALELAWRKILDHNPFPAVCGRVCQHPCELNCNRKLKNGAVAINRLEQFVGDFAIARGLRSNPGSLRTANAPRVAIIGAGPAGLSAAYHLALKGIAVTVYDAAPAAGGMMRYRIPRSILPAEILDAEIANILHLGIELHTGCAVCSDTSIDQLKHDFRVIYFAAGLQKAADLELRPGSNKNAALIGALPAGGPVITESESLAVEQRILNTVSPAIAQGRSVAEKIAAFLEGRVAGSSSKPQTMRADRMKLDWYAAAPRFDSAAPMTEAEVFAEAARCMSCGMCMDCETCWMYCSKNCFTKLPKGEHYKINLDVCNGCGKCAEACPCGYIEMN